jgi:4-hydroxybenzoate polyprenyltransferase
VEAAAPIGGYLAVTGEFSWLALLPGVAILFWIAGIDILYSVQDVEFDREENLYSVPAKFGVANARRIASVSYLLAVVALVAAGYYTYMGLIYFVAVLSVSIIFSRQQWIAFKGEGDVEASMGKVFFLNRFISPVLFAGALADWLLRYFF